ncbi:CAP domain-containing protein [Ancylobacter terrae]|uniref:CAP domain-containing protein n=1 Tax=Ancylobacter sp. sgz301288 TaxID=3342077 RepID=UPI00385DE8E6
MRRASFPLLTLTATAALLAACSTAPTQTPPSGNPSFYDNLSRGGTVDSAAAAALISDYRQGKGLSAVTVDPVLTQVAQKQAKAMAATGELSHSVGGRGLTTRLKAAGFDGLRAAENVGAGYHTLAEAFSGWRDSPSHNRNMLMPGATRIGIAAAPAPNSKYKVFWALVLGVPDNRTSAGPGQPAAPAPGETSVTLNGAQLPQ